MPDEPDIMQLGREAVKEAGELGIEQVLEGLDFITSPAVGEERSPQEQRTFRHDLLVQPFQLEAYFDFKAAQLKTPQGRYPRVVVEAALLASKEMREEVGA